MRLVDFVRAGRSRKRSAADDPATEFFDLANDLEYQLGELLGGLNTIRATLK